MSMPGTLADVPGVDAIIHELEGRVEERRQRAHVEVGHDEPAPVVRPQPLDDFGHLGEVSLSTLQQLSLRNGPEGARLSVHPGWPSRPALGPGALARAR